MTTLDEILEIIATYRELPADYVDIANLMYMRKKLATLGVNLGVEVGVARANWKTAQGKYEITRTQKQIGFYGKQKNLEKSKMYAKANTEEFLDKATEAENDFYSLDYAFRALKEVLSELNQRISYLRDEYKQEQFYNKGN